MGFSTTLEVCEFPVIDVTVYFDRAEVKRLLKCEVPKGTHIIDLKKLCPNMIENSYRVHGVDKTIIHVATIKPDPEYRSIEISRLEEAVHIEKSNYRKVKDSMNFIERKIDLVQKLILQSSEGTISIDSPRKIDKLSTNITNLLDLFINKSKDLIKEKDRLNQDLDIAEFRIEKTERELREMTDKNGPPIPKTITVIVESCGGEAEFEFVYQVREAYWRPSYDFRITNATEEKENNLRIDYYGVISQNTGEDWSCTPITLSTAKPILDSEIPSAGTFIASFEAGSDVDGHILSSASCSTKENVVVEYPIVCEAQIRDGSIMHRVVIALVDIQPILNYNCIPSKTSQVFATVAGVNESSINFLAGPIDVFMNESFVAKATFKHTLPNEHFMVPLGTYPAIKVEHKLVKQRRQIDLCKNICIDLNEQEIIIHNKAKHSIVLTIIEPFPKSKDNRIRINVRDPVYKHEEDQIRPFLEIPTTASEGCIMNIGNILEWTVKLEPCEDQTLVLEWNAEYPADHRLYIKSGM